MYQCLRPWLTGDVTYRPYEGLNAAGDKVFGEPVHVKGYWVSGTQVITDSRNREVTSTTQLYYDPADYEIGPDDRVLIDGRERDVLTVTGWMDGNTGEMSCKLVYL